MAGTEDVQTGAEEKLRAVIAKYEAAIPRALEARDDGIRRVADEYGLRQVDVIRITGYSRETVRQVLNPRIRTAIRKAAGERKAARNAE